MPAMQKCWGEIYSDMTIEEKIRRLDILQKTIQADIFFSIEPFTKELTKAQRSQLWDGKRADGWDIRPFYTEDRHFRTYEDAKEYMEWKRKITPNPRRRIDAPNLYINGRFYSEIQVVADLYGISTRAVTAKAQRIMNKYSKGTFGVSEQNARRIFREKAMPLLIKRLKRKI